MLNRGLVLGGGGSRGAYEIGVWRAARELKIDFDVVTGTSIGALNGALVVQGDYDFAVDMWENMNYEAVMTNVKAEDFTTLDGTRKAFRTALREIVADGGMEIGPLEELVRSRLDEEKIRQSPKEFGIVTVEIPSLKASEMAKEDIPQGQMADYLLASAACYPAFKRRTIDNKSYVDGGYRDNMPTALAQKMGAEELVCVDLEGVGITRPNRTGLPTTLIRSYWELGDILHFEPATARRNIELGYHDTLRAFGRLRGCAYAVDSGAESSADAAAFHAAFEAVQKDVREKHPSTLTADAALLLAKLSDAELAPLEAVAEDVGVDPAPYYTTRTLGEAFLAKCDFERLRSFEPLFEGEAGPAQAARAALLPNTFLQALVCRALTGRVPPEEMET